MMCLKVILCGCVGLKGLSDTDSMRSEDDCSVSVLVLYPFSFVYFSVNSTVSMQKQKKKETLLNKCPSARTDN